MSSDLRVSREAERGGKLNISGLGQENARVSTLNTGHSHITGAREAAQAPVTHEKADCVVPPLPLAPTDSSGDSTVSTLAETKGCVYHSGHGLQKRIVSLHPCNLLLGVFVDTGRGSN